MKRVFVVAMVCLVLSRQTAKAQDAGINGKWHFVMDTEGGNREMNAEFAVDGDGKVTGKFGDTAIAGTFRDGKLDLSFPMTAHETGEMSSLRLTGKLDGASSLTGNWEFSQYGGTFKATRQK
ncbi:MAG TPA: hypothetical protein VMT15_07170 [Bryobacteraceae bacterium]|nr:hypothetical protein [Bryobacteraceae bacterium]